MKAWTIQEYRVLMTFKHPAWDEKNGYVYYVNATSKSEACKRARSQADYDGHSGVRYFKAAATQQGE